MMRDYFYLFRKSLKFFSHSNIFDFKIPIQKTKIKSITMSKNQIIGLNDLLIRFSNIFSWLNEVVFPMSSRFCIA